MISEIAWLFAPAAAALVLALAVAPVRRAFVDASRCVTRHPIVWKVPAGFALAYGLFQIGGEMMLTVRAGSAWPAPWGEPPPDWSARAAALFFSLPFPAAERLAGDLNCLVATFPLSAGFGLLFLINAQGLASELRRALTRTLRWVGWPLFAVLVLCAAAATAKPFMLLFLPELADRLPLRGLLLASTALNAAAFAFEYLLGTGAQVLLLLTVSGWVRGFHYPRERLLRFAVRRLGFVVKWSAIPVVVTLAFLHLPPFLETAATGAPASGPLEMPARVLLLALMLLCPAVQIRLALHNDSLRDALRENAAFLRRHGPATAVFLAVAFGLLVSLGGAIAVGRVCLEGTLAGAGWELGGQIAAACAGGWILAAWVCFYAGRAERARPLPV